jgi:LysM repeat protein
MEIGTRSHEEEKERMYVHLVTKGQTLAEIGEMYGVSVPELVASNPFITDPNVIYAGQFLMIPSSMKVRLHCGCIVPMHSAWGHMCHHTHPSGMHGHYMPYY